MPSAFAVIVILDSFSESLIVLYHYGNGRINTMDGLDIVFGPPGVFHPSRALPL